MVSLLCRLVHVYLHRARQQFAGLHDSVHSFKGNSAFSSRHQSSSVSVREGWLPFKRRLVATFPFPSHRFISPCPHNTTAQLLSSVRNLSLRAGEMRPSGRSNDSRCPRLPQRSRDSEWWRSYMTPRRALSAASATISVLYWAGTRSRSEWSAPKGRTTGMGRGGGSRDYAGYRPIAYVASSP